MSVVINTNTSATIAANNLAYSNSMLQHSLNELSSGSKLVSSSSDAGGTAVSMKLTAAVARSTATSNNVSDTQSFLQTQDGVLQVSASIMNRVSELYTLYQDPTKNTSDLSDYDAEFTQLQSELTQLGNESFNGVSLFGSSSLTVKVSEDGAQTVTLSGANLTDSSSGVGAISSTSSATSLGALSLSDITTAIQNIGTMRATNGAEQSRLNFASQVLTANTTNLQAANSTISDVDVAQASTQLARWNVLVSAGTSMLAQANQSSQSVLKLIS